MTAEKAAEILERLEDVKSTMADCDIVAKLLETRMAIYVGTEGKDKTTFTLRSPVIRTAVAGALKANYNLLRDEYDELLKQVQRW